MRQPIFCNDPYSPSQNLLPRASLDFALSNVGNCHRRRRCRRHHIQFHRLIACALRTEYAKRLPRAAAVRPTAAARARARSGGNNNSFELKTNSDLGGHEGKRPANPLYQCRPSFLPKVRLNPTYLGAKSQIYSIHPFFAQLFWSSAIKEAGL